MPVMFIILRKKILLPIKWWFKRKKHEALFEYPSVSDVLDKENEAREKLLKAEREDDRDSKLYYEGVLSVYEWLIYGGTKDKES